VLLIIPLAWCAITGVTLWTMQSPEALLMPAAGLLTLVLAVCKAWRAKEKVAPN
jgi:hypothetical protein